MFKTLKKKSTNNKKSTNKKKKIPVKRYLRKGLENAKGTRHIWSAPTYKLKENEEWLNEWRVKEGKNEIFFDSAPTQEEIRKKIEDKEREEKEAEEKMAKLKQERIEKDNKKKIRKAELDKERKEIEDASNIMLESWQNDNKSIIEPLKIMLQHHSGIQRIIEPLKIMLQHYSGIQRIQIPRNFFIPGESWADDKTHMTIRRPQIDNTGRGDYTRVRKSHIYVTILVPNDNDFTLSQLTRSEFERGDWELGFKVAEMPDDNYVSEDGGIVKSGLFTVVKGKGFGNDYRAKWYE